LGKPFLSELYQLEETYSNVLSVDTSILDKVLLNSLRYPLIAVGSGGSLSAAHFASYLHQQFTGKMASASTPLEILSVLSNPISRKSIIQSSVLCLSASGSNNDINRVWQTLIKVEPYCLSAICARKDSRLAKIGERYEYAKIIDFDLPSKKDGFLATNSLVSFLILLVRSFSKLLDTSTELPSTLWNLIPGYDNLDSALDILRSKLNTILERECFVILHGFGTKAAAYDIESKFTEAALGYVQLSDFRNFAHGRHHWLAKRAEDSAIIAFAQDNDIALAEKTVDLIPPSVPSIVFHFPGNRLLGSIAAIIEGFLITAIAGEKRNIDPGRPGVPQFGRRLYHLGIGRINKETKREKAPVLRKAVVSSSSTSELMKSYNTFSRSLKRTLFSGLVLDYDGTLCKVENRFEPLDKQITRELLRLLNSSIPLGIATGRGKSVRKALQEALPEKVWGQIIVGYYNGAECAPLEDNFAPDGTNKCCFELEPVLEVLNTVLNPKSMSSMNVRKKQISLEPNNSSNLDDLWNLIGLYISRLDNVKTTISSHSIDILTLDASKLNVIDTLKTSLLEPKSSSFLCIGDQGRWPGNDSELLSTAHALSVDTVSSDLSTCWNIAPEGYRGPQATLFYLKCIVPQNGKFRFLTARGRST
jgi:fructoselysine-6-P-deglycase FrlB-like protein